MIIIPDSTEKTVKIEVHVVNGEILHLYGGKIPLQEGAIGDLIVKKDDIIDKNFLIISEKEITKCLLPQNTELLVHINPKEKLLSPLQESIQPCPKLRPNDFFSMGGFIPVKILEPLAINLRGSKKGNLSSCHCEIRAPLKDTMAKSLNHAYSLISQTFEPHRRSHSGNVFEKFYFCDKDGYWKPLEVLREEWEAEDKRRFSDKRKEYLPDEMQLDIFSIDMDSSKNY